VISRISRFRELWDYDGFAWTPEYETVKLEHYTTQQAMTLYKNRNSN
jgi:hypothetical protein